MLTQQENETLTSVGPATDMGQVMRRFWIPALSSAELPEPNSDPKLVKLLGESLVAFRDSNGKVAVMDSACPHRGSSLAIGRAEGDGIRCLYHGWKIGCEGRVLETPNEPPGSWLKEKVRVAAYPVRERGGLVWVYMGPAEEEPPFPEFDWLDIDPELIAMSKMHVEANWVQVLEGAVDSSHVSFLHADSFASAPPSVDTQYDAFAAQAQSEEKRYEEDAIALVRLQPTSDNSPRIEVEDTPYGFRYAAIRSPAENPELYDYVRITHFIAPIFVTLPTTDGFGTMQIFVPMDDNNTMWHAVRYSLGKRFDRAAHVKMIGATPGIDIDENFRKVRRRENSWLQDRAQMRNDESFSGIEGINNEDFAVQESMGYVVDRTKEHLGLADRAVIRTRRILLRMARQMAEEKPLLGGGLHEVDYSAVKATSGLVSVSEPWQSLENPPLAV